MEPKDKKKSKWETTGIDFAETGDPTNPQPSDWVKDADFTVTLPPRTEDHDLVSSYGQAVTKRAANVMLREKLRRVNEKLNKFAPNSEDERMKLLKEEDGLVIFSREVLSFVLCQPGCAGIKFYFCVNHEEERSLVFVGVDMAGNDIGEKRSIMDQDLNLNNPNEQSTQETTVQRSAIMEVGGPYKPPGSINKLYTYYDIVVDKSKQLGDFGDIVRQYLGI